MPLRAFYLRQNGNALVLTMITVVAVVSMISLGSERMFAARKQSTLSADRAKAQIAAETLSALIEAKLYELAAESALRLKEDLDTGNNPAFWWNLRGFTYNSGAATNALYLNGCALRWRVEPVKVMSTTVDSGGAAASGAEFTVNSESDTSKTEERKEKAGSGLFDIDAGYYHFRIVTEAYTLTDPTAVSAVPWLTPGTHTASVQAQRVLQLKDVNLFKYVIFYAATGPTGDIEFHNGPDLEIYGSVHSNGAIYLGGSGSGYYSGQYNTSATNGGGIIIGTAAKPVGITGVDGIFRLRKQANHRMAQVNSDSTLRNPYEVPFPGETTAGGVLMTGQDNLNGDSATSSKIMLNGVRLVYTNDSRSGLSNSSQPAPNNTWKHHATVTDASNRDAQIVRAIANVPSFSGYPLENARETGSGSRLRTSSGNYTIKMVPGTSPVAGNPSGADLPLFDFPQAGGTTDRAIWPSQPTAADPRCSLPPILGLELSGSGLTLASSWALDSTPDTVANTAKLRSFNYLPMLPNTNPPTIPYQALNDYFRWSILGTSFASDKSGLTIRERGMQNLKWINDATSAVASGGGGVTWPTTYTDKTVPPTLAAFTGATPPQTSAQWVRAYAWWMKSNYAVYLGKKSGSPVDITHEFFEFNLTTAESAGKIDKLMATEDLMADVREKRWENDNNFTGTDSNVLTLNVGLIMDFLRTTPLTNLQGHVGATGLAHTLFNGLLYAHRTHRYDTFGVRPFAHPLKTNGYHPLALPAVGTPPNRTGGVYPMTGMVGLAPSSAVEVGAVGGWSMYHSTRSVRLKNGADINHGGVQTNFSNRRGGLTVVTPNPCYLWGNYNSIKAADNQVTPCAVFADSVTVLSNAWKDANANNSTRPTGDHTIYFTSFVINNMPTDAQNIVDAGSGGVHTVLRLLEDWTGKTFHFRGSLVVLNRMRYSRGTLHRNSAGASSNYVAPNRLYEFNSDLLTGGGQPPFSLKGTVPTRVVSTVNVLNN